MDIMSEYASCRLCARNCGVDRLSEKLGYCKSSYKTELARAALHRWEEPIVSGDRGSGTVFFTGCSLGCIYCQNRSISRKIVGKEVTIKRLSDIMLELEKKGAHNINLVTPTHYAPSVVKAVKSARENNLSLPIIYNTSSYDNVRTIDFLSDTVDVYLADFKYWLPATSQKYSMAQDYPSVAKAAIERMILQKGNAIIQDGLIKSGVIVRILLLPGHLAQAKLITSYLINEYGDSIYLSLMSQYTPFGNLPSPLDRKVGAHEYALLCDYAVKKGLRNGFIQEGSSASESFIPQFDLSGV